MLSVVTMAAQEWAQGKDTNRKETNGKWYHRCIDRDRTRAQQPYRTRSTLWAVSVVAKFWIPRKCSTSRLINGVTSIRWSIHDPACLWSRFVTAFMPWVASTVSLDLALVISSIFNRWNLKLISNSYHSFMVDQFIHWLQSLDLFDFSCFFQMKKIFLQGCNRTICDTFNKIVTM